MSHSCSVESGVFGVPIHVLVHRDSQRVENLKVPLFLQETLEFLEKNGIDCEGILRIPGSSVRMKVCGCGCGCVRCGCQCWCTCKHGDGLRYLSQIQIPSPRIVGYRRGTRVHLQQWHILVGE